MHGFELLKVKSLDMSVEISPVKCLLLNTTISSAHFLLFK